MFIFAIIVGLVTLTYPYTILEIGEGDVIQGSIDVSLRSQWQRCSSSIGSPSQQKDTSGGGALRIFSLQRIFEVLVNVLRQLSFNFIEKSKLTDFNFQRRFLAPFLFIMEDHQSKFDLRELVLRFMDNMF